MSGPTYGRGKAAAVAVERATKLTIRSLDHAAQDAGAAQCLVRGMADHMERVGGQWLPTGLDAPVFVAERGGEVAGVLAWRHDVQAAEITVNFAYVEPKARRRSVLPALLLAVRTKARELKANQIDYCVSAKNDQMAKAAEALGAEATATWYRVTLGPAPEPKSPVKQGVCPGCNVRHDEGPHRQGCVFDHPDSVWARRA